MITIEEIRNDLRDIRYYYTHQNIFTEALKQLGGKYINKKGEKIQ